ncbi:hypothetical protein RclHR1_05390008 [Rhizophagus clarus]|uniref:Uncharacterized protein n=1 Tax=Rhizophagus clarus TaxID=94130 RepID=A0A2Z6RM12_9GLOM|nr:hypothetical protein RclHR1_05390008 [Rhizophagus clarus]
MENNNKAHSQHSEQVDVSMDKYERLRFCSPFSNHGKTKIQAHSQHVGQVGVSMDKYERLRFWSPFSNHKKTTIQAHSQHSDWHGCTNLNWWRITINKVGTSLPDSYLQIVQICFNTTGTNNDHTFLEQLIDPCSKDVYMQAEFSIANILRFSTLGEIIDTTLEKL